METTHFSDTSFLVSPLGLVATVAMGILLLLVPRRYAFIPIVMLTCYMPMGQTLMVGSFHFTMLRILLLFGWARVILRGELHPILWNRIDFVILAWIFVKFSTYLVLWQTGDALVYALGFVYNALGFYFFFRMLLRTPEDIVQVYKITAVLIVPLAVLMMLEKLSGRNAFAVFGGVLPITVVREGVLRCSGPFAHPILAGTFGATLLPFFVVLWRKGIAPKLIASAGIASALVITLTSGSSGPVLAAAGSIAALCMWPIRNSMRVVRWATGMLLIGLQLVMKVPVWFLLARVDVFSGSTGYHRAYLIDRAFANLSDWWLIGTKSTASWADIDQGLFDVTNQYLVEGANGGLITMLLFIGILVCGFRYVGLSVRKAGKNEDPFMLLSIWALGAALFAHLVTYISVSYFDQNIINWYLLLAMIATVTDRLVLAPALTEATATNSWTDMQKTAFASLEPLTPRRVPWVQASETLHGRSPR